MKNFIQYGNLIERISWLIKLRWTAVAGVILTIFFADRIFNLSIPIFPLYSLSILLGVYNFVFFIYLKQIEKKTQTNLLVAGNRMANVQISLDLFTLTALIHFSGGIENPFIFYFIFHMVIASILLSRRASFLQATFAVFLFCLMVALEYFDILPHYCLKGFVVGNLHNNLIYIAGVSFAFISTLYIAVYMATSISSRLREANKLLRKKDRLKSEYVLRVTHDIKEHLAAIQSCIEPVTEGITGPLNEKQKNLLQRADKRTGKLLFFVKALLGITQIKLHDKIKMEYFSIKDAVKNAVANVEAKAKNKNIALTTHVDPVIDKIKGVQAYIEEAILDLLANSVKYTPDNGKIGVTVSDKGDNILIQIKDTGIGIPKNDLPKVFDEFYRASNAKGIEKDGTGLGLSIAKQITERHNGKIWAESEEGKGSAFNIILPK